MVHFLLSHSDTVSAILRNRNISALPAQLEEAALLTGVISRAAGWNAISEESPAATESSRTSYPQLISPLHR